MPAAFEERRDLFKMDRFIRAIGPNPSSPGKARMSQFAEAARRLEVVETGKRPRLSTETARNKFRASRHHLVITK